METISRTSRGARELARIPVGKTWINTDAVEEARQMGARWVRVSTWGGEGRGVYGILETPNWQVFDDGTNDLSETRLAIVVDEAQDLGRDAWVEYGGKRYPIDRYQYSGVVYYLRGDDDPGLDRPMPAGAVPIERVMSLPNLIRVSGLHQTTDA